MMKAIRLHHMRDPTDDNLKKKGSVYIAVGVGIKIWREKMGRRGRGGCVMLQPWSY